MAELSAKAGSERTTMKSLLLLRHAKAEPDAPGGDRERRLTARGRHDAAAAGRIIAGLGLPIDLIVSSEARRAWETAEIVASVLGWQDPIRLETRIYGASVGTLLDVIHGLPETAACALLVGHNPGFAELAATLAGAGELSLAMRTASVAHLEIDSATWHDALPGSARVLGIRTGRAETAESGSAFEHSEP
jgi:phosphohistidine phosphatase